MAEETKPKKVKAKDMDISELTDLFQSTVDKAKGSDAFKRAALRRVKV